MKAKTRRRGVELEDALLLAASEELRAGGYAAFSMENVAVRAGTNKNALYRRWPNRAALALAALRAHRLEDDQLPNTGKLRSDVLVLLRGANTRWTLRGATLRAILAEVSDDPELLARTRELIIEGVNETWLQVLGHAVARGEVQPHVLHPRVASVALVLLRNEFIVRGVSRVEDHVIVEICDQVYLPLVLNYASPNSARVRKRRARHA
jgi:AcrR family transcriptional regulator